MILSSLSLKMITIRRFWFVH